MIQNVCYLSGRIYWFFDHKNHRDRDLPATYYFENGKLYSVNYCQHNQLHRTTGPAVINYASKNKSYWYQAKVYNSLEEIHMLEACR